MILWFDGQTSLAIWCFAMIAAILPYIMLNLGILGRRYKVFMGDAGSTLIGFTVIWILLETTQGKTHPISPVTALWIIAIPLMDMVAIMYRRLRKGMSPFSPDRQHIHHLIDACRVYFPPGVCADYPCRSSARLHWGAGGIFSFCPGVGHAGALFASIPSSMDIALSVPGKLLALLSA